MIDKSLLAILACPACKGDVEPEGDLIVCRNASCALRFPVREGIPVMLIEEAQKLEKETAR